MSPSSWTVTPRVTVWTGFVMYCPAVSSRNLYTMRSRRCCGCCVGALRSMRQQDATRRLRYQMLRHASEHEFAKAGMAIGAGYDQAGTEIIGDVVQSLRGIGAFAAIRHPRRRDQPMAGEPADDIADPRLR